MRLNLAFWAFTAVFIVSPGPQAQASSEYYAPLEGVSGGQFRAALSLHISGHEIIPYSSSRFDVHDAIDILDVVSGNDGQVHLIYANTIADTESWPAYNREHLWPQSLGAHEGSPAHSDLHHIYACDASVNSSRNNKAFDDCDGACKSHWESPEAFYDVDSWEPPTDQKGDIARALFYMELRYEGFDGEPDLQLVDGAVYEGCDCMGQRETLLKWHAEDPPDAAERARHEGVYEMQGNRNPFIDHPEWVCTLYGACDGVGETPFISEIHYDNAGADLDEGVEVTVPPGVDISGWTLHFYNGNGGGTYGKRALEMPSEAEVAQGGIHYLWLPYHGVQNGGADGMALVDAEGNVIEFISYEGQLWATSGPAEGMKSMDIGVLQSNAALGTSLQRLEDGIWHGGRPASPGLANATP